MIFSTTYIHTYTRLMALFCDNPDKPVPEGSGISWAVCKSAPHSKQITMPAPHHSVFLQARCPSCRPTNSVKALISTTWSSFNVDSFVSSQFGDFYLKFCRHFMPPFCRQNCCLRRLSFGQHSLQGYLVLMYMCAIRVIADEWTWDKLGRILCHSNCMHVWCCHRD